MLCRVRSKTSLSSAAPTAYSTSTGTSTTACQYTGASIEQMVETTRIRDTDLDPQRYDPDTGEYIPQQAPALRQREAADLWVAHQLNGRHNIKSRLKATP